MNLPILIGPSRFVRTAITPETAVTDPNSRMDALRRFIAAAIACDDFTLQPASADASFRSYWRVTSQQGGTQNTRIVMDAPPQKEDIRAWIDVGARLRAAGVHAPEIFAVDQDAGFLLMEDLGDRNYLLELDEQSVDALYADALDALLRMQTHVDVAGLPVYDRQRLIDEMELMPEWFLKRHLGFTPECEEWDIIEMAFTQLVHAAAEQPRAFVHRDFHSRNLLIASYEEADADSGIVANPAVIDFQDAVIGPITYDLVSLLRDCYITWDAERVDGWVESYRERLASAHLIGPEVTATRFDRWFDLTGLQRHIKVLGIFCRLWYRDGKAQYLRDLDRVWDYTIDVAQRHPEFADLAALLRKARGARDITEPRTQEAGA